MKTSLFGFLLLAPLSIIAHENDEATRFMLQRRDQNSNRAMAEPCTVVSLREAFTEGRVEEYLECELHGEDLIDGESFRMVRLQGLWANWATDKGIVSGVSTIFAPGSLINDDTNALVIVNTAAVQVVVDPLDGDVDKRRGRNLQKVGTKKVLVIRVDAQDSSTTATEAQLGDDIFGQAGDLVNLKSQYLKCSHDQLNFTALESKTEVGTDGIYTLTLPEDVRGQKDNPIVWRIVNQAQSELGGSLNIIADHVIVCMPPGTAGGWIAYAYINHWLSVYNNNWCRYPSGLMHELGHNLGLAHSGEDASYDDRSGMMGYSYQADDTPKMCFNGPKSWQLGWYSEYHVDLSTNDYNWSGDLVGFAEKKDLAQNDSTSKMIIRIKNPNSNTDTADTYVHFNRQIGFNSETKEGPNQVLVGTRTSGESFDPSTLRAKLNADDSYTIDDIGVTITVNSIDTSVTPAKANISITGPTPAPVEGPTPAPVEGPTPAPVVAPTSAPVVAPTSAPVVAPTSAPVVPPTSAPVVPPTSAPVVPPTSAPVVPPTSAPVVPPTSVPVVPPTSAPVAAPSMSNAPSSEILDCISGDFMLEVKGYCSYTALLSSFEDWFAEPGNAIADCPNSAEEQLARLLNVNVNATGDLSDEVHSICSGAFQNYDKVPFKTSTGADERFVEDYYKGNGDWNEQVATLFPEYDGAGTRNKETMLLKRDAKVVDDFHNEEGRHSIVELPDLPNFETCEMNAAYCCWPKDRQDDNDGNCDAPYDYRCNDADPGDNTDLCFVNHADGAKSTGYNTTDGWFTFPFDDGNNRYDAEGPIHCHGFAWAEDENDPSNVYRGNNLFFVSLFDHMYTRGYVSNIAGAPMCACAEQMPTVSRSDCTQIDFENQEQNFVFTFRDDSFSAELVEVFIDFNACQGIDENGKTQNNDLWSYMNRLYLDDKVGPEKVQALTQKLVGDGNCPLAERRHLAEHNLVRGHNEIDDTWTVLRGRDALYEDKFYGKEAFKYLADANSTEPAILMRGCASCHYDQQWLFYKRVTPIPENLDLWWQLQYGRDRSGVVGNRYGVDFLIYGSHEDALNDENAWECPSYDGRSGFPGNCAPYRTRRNSQGSLFDQWWTRTDVAWFVENKGDKTLHAIAETEAELDALKGNGGAFSSMVTTAIGAASIPGYSYTKGSGGDVLLMSAAGKDISGNSDNFRFTHESTSGDVTMVVRISSLDYREHWTKAGLMIRDSLEPDAKHFSVLMLGKNGVGTFWRKDAGRYTYYQGYQRNVVYDSVWLKLTKRMNVFTGYKSFDGEEWIQVGSPQTVEMDVGDLKVGLALTSHHSGKQTEAIFENFENSNYFYPSSAPSASPAPSLTVLSQDIGRYNAALPSQVSIQGSKYMVKASGRDIWGREDGFTFINSQVSGDFDMTVQMSSFEPVNRWSKFGLMARNSLDSKSKYVMTFFAPNVGASMMHIRQRRSSYSRNYAWATKRPKSIWLRLKRVGNDFFGYESVVGESLKECVWRMQYKFSSAHVTFDNSELEIGMVVTSHDNNKYASVVFDHFNIDTSGTGTEQRALRGSA